MPHRNVFFEEFVKVLAGHVVPIRAENVVLGEGAVTDMAPSPRRRASKSALLSCFHDFAHFCTVSIMVAIFTSTVPYFVLAAAFLMVVAKRVEVIALPVAAILVVFEETASCVFRPWEPWLVTRGCRHVAGSCHGSLGTKADLVVFCRRLL